MQPSIHFICSQFWAFQITKILSPLCDFESLFKIRTLYQRQGCVWRYLDRIHRIVLWCGKLDRIQAEKKYKENI